MGHDKDYYEIHHVTKIFPTFVKQIDFKSPIRKTVEGRSARDKWNESFELGLVFESYDEYIKRKKRNKINLALEKQTPDIKWQLQLPFDEQYKRFHDSMLAVDEIQPHLDELDRERSLKRSVRRSVMNVKELGFCNDFDMFITFTIGKDHYDVQKSIRKMTSWLKEQQKKQKEQNGTGFEYILVMEYHKKGGVHFHALTNNYMGRFAVARHPKTGNKIIKKGKVVHNILDYKYGFSTMTFIGDKDKAVSYLTKYITKTFAHVEYMGKKRYWRSRGLKKAEIVYNQTRQIPENSTVYETDMFRLTYITRGDIIT